MSGGRVLGVLIYASGELCVSGMRAAWVVQDHRMVERVSGPCQ